MAGMGREARLHCGLAMPRYLKRSPAFPLLDETNHEVTSNKSRFYNCVAWAFGITNAHWWPDEDHYWPPGVIRAETIDGFVEAFQSQGYEVCPSGSREDGYEKIAIYGTRLGSPHHVARQLEDGEWTSKMGTLDEDIRHTSVNVIASGAYGNPQTYMRRPRA